LALIPSGTEEESRSAFWCRSSRSVGRARGFFAGIAGLLAAPAADFVNERPTLSIDSSFSSMDLKDARHQLRTCSAEGRARCARRVAGIGKSVTPSGGEGVEDRVH